MPDPSRLLFLAGFAWPEAGLRRLDDILTRLKGRAGWKETAVNYGFVEARVLLITSETSSHLRQPLAGAALRHQMILHVDIFEYREPEFWLPGNEQVVQYDFVLLALSPTAWNLDADPRTSSPDACEAALERAARLLETFSPNHAKTVILQTLPPHDEVLQGSMDLAIAGTQRNLIRRFNVGLAALCARSGALLLDAEALASMAGTSHWRPGRFGTLAKLPFSQQFVPAYCDWVCRLLASRLGKSRRVLVLDLDNTLWSGVIGDDGLEHIHMAPGNPVGESHRAIQKLALAAHQRGIVLCISSKNTYDIAIKAFQEHPDMLIRESDVALFHINWRDKASNISEMARTLALGLDAFVLIDDNPAERLQVRSALPQVAVPELPQDVTVWPHLLSAAGYFEQTALTDEDFKRAEFYRANAQRSQSIAQFADLTEYLTSLNMVMTVRPFDATGRARIAQLVAKSNQFNLTTRRYSIQEIDALEQSSQHVTMQIHLSDRFGDNGMISCIVGRQEGDSLFIDLWVMSCRVLSRRVEEASLVALTELASERGVSRIVGTYLQSAKNSLVKDHYANLGFQQCSGTPASESNWLLDLAKYIPHTPPISIKRS